MRSHLRLRCQKKRPIVLVVTITCSLFLYLLIKNRGSILSPSTYGYSSDNTIYHSQMLEPEKLHYPLPGAYMEDFIPSNISYCKFNYNLPDQLNYKEEELQFSPQLGRQGTYRVLYNIIEGQFTGNRTPAVTYCTHVTPVFIYHIAEIIRYWESPISVAAFVPDVDADITIQLLRHLCFCLPGMARVSVHFVFPGNRPPYIIQKQKRSIRSSCGVSDVTDLQTYRNRENLPYPVNVCRNVARNSAKTSHVLVSDVELIPSKNLSTKFSKMMKKVRVIRFPSYHVFVVPVFEVETGEEIPRTKKELKRLYDIERAVYFHRWVCLHCQRFPGLVKWLNTKLPKSGEEVVKPFIVAKREDPFHRWEPIYIGTNQEPFYSETLSWEGQQDKMTQMLEMCLMGYKYVILDGAFLVHWPGVKRRTTETKLRNEWRKPHQKQNTKQYDVIINYLASKYTENDRCKLQ